MKYVVARPWNPNKPERGLCIYTYGSEIQSGELNEARDFLEYVRRQATLDGDQDRASAYGIYEVTFTRISDER